MAYDPRLKPERPWRLFEVDGFQVLGTLHENFEDREVMAVTVETVVNGVEVQIAVVGGNEELAYKILNGLDGPKALASLLDKIAPMMDDICEGEDDEAAV